MPASTPTPSASTVSTTPPASGSSSKLLSMTAYGYGEVETPGLTYACEIRTLNSRFLEVNVRIPRQLLALETDMINHVKASLRRGKVDVFIDLVRAGGARDLPSIDETATQHYLGEMARLSRLVQESGVSVEPAPFRLVDLMRLDGLMGQGERQRSRGHEGAEAQRAPVFAALDKALTKVREARAKEGTALVAALLELLAGLRERKNLVAAQRDELLAAMQRGYLKRLGTVAASVQKAVAAGDQVLAAAGGGQIKVGDERLLAEIAILLDKADIDEELTRLGTHLDEFERLLTSEETAGRKLDFLCQELHREVNTMSNKLVQTEVAQHTIEMKQAIERIRQQVQNIE